MGFKGRSSPYRAVNTLRLGYKTSQLMLYREITAVCSEIHTKHTNSSPDLKMVTHMFYETLTFTTYAVPISQHSTSD
jgi:hypothetical protein